MPKIHRNIANRAIAGNETDTTKRRRTPTGSGKEEAEDDRWNQRE